MTKRRSTASFRRDHDLLIHKLIPHACAYSVALNDGDPVGCEEEIEAMASLLMSEMKMAARPTPTAMPECPPGGNVTAIGRPFG